MRLYIKSDFSKKIPFGYEELAHKMWFRERRGKKIEIGHSGNDETLQEGCYCSLSYPKWLNDEEWNVPEIVELHSLLKTESLFMDFEEGYVTDYRELGEDLRILSSHKDMLTVDKRAMYIMAIEVATVLDGQISEDDKASWLSVEAFQEKHQDVLSLTFEEANDISLEEVFTMEAIDEPLWDELDRQRKEYIKLHGEREWDDYEDWEDDDWEEEEEGVILYIKGDFSKKIPFDYEELAHKMWFKERNGKAIEIDYEIDDEMSQENYSFWLSYPKWLNDKEWHTPEIKALCTDLTDEMIKMNVKGGDETDNPELRISSTHKDMLTVDKRAMYIMAIEVATALDGQISEDDKASWLSVSEFQEKHQDILSLTFEEANAISHKELFTILGVAEPLQDELDCQREEDIKRHGEHRLDDGEEVVDKGWFG